MATLTVGLADRSYPIRIGAGTLWDLGEACAGLGLGKKTAIVTNPTVAAPYLEPVRRSLTRAGFAVTGAFLGRGPPRAWECCRRR